MPGTLPDRAGAGGVRPRGGVREVDHVAYRLDQHGRHRQRPDAARARRPQLDTAGVSKGEPDIDHILLNAVERGVQPGPERREHAGVPGELPVHAVEDERQVEQRRARDLRAALPRGEGDRREAREADREPGDGVRREPEPGGQPHHVPRPRAHEVRRDEAVIGLDRGLQPGAVLVDLSQPVDGGVCAEPARDPVAVQPPEGRRPYGHADAHQAREQQVGHLGVLGGAEPLVLGEVGELLRDVGQAPEIGLPHVQDAPEAAVGAAHGVEGVARGDHPAALRADRRKPIVLWGDQRAGAPRGVGQQQGERLGVGDQVAREHR